MLKKISIVLFLLSLAISSCGRKSALTYDGERKQPNFSKVTDE